LPRWTVADVPPQTGRSVVITGTGGLGFEDAIALARAGADVILAGRSPDKGAGAVERIRAAVPGASICFEQIDLASLKSIADFCSRLGGERGSLDILINNAGVMVPPRRVVTRDGFELQWATNYLGHFALTAGLLPLLRKGHAARVVSLSSVAASSGKINFDDLQSAKAYKAMVAYSQSKLACLMFGFELQRRSDARGWGLTSIASHPGISRTDLLYNAPGPRSTHGFARNILWFLFQPAAQGALPTLFAATSPEAIGGGYYGPDGVGETRGYPKPAKTPSQALDGEVAKRLWDVSEELAGLRFG
jgi:NAD(P)-dependent dehydrogenase (short-subunit alcohol dehydrogenase family)